MRRRLYVCVERDANTDAPIVKYGKYKRDESGIFAVRDLSTRAAARMHHMLRLFLLLRGCAHIQARNSKLGVFFPYRQRTMLHFSPFDFRALNLKLNLEFNLQMRGEIRTSRERTARYKAKYITP